MASGAQLSHPETGLVKWASVGSLQVEIRSQERLKPDHRELDEGYLWIRIFDATLDEVPLRSLHEQAVDVDTDFRRLFDILFKDSLDMRSEGKSIYSGHCCTGVRLQGRRHKTLWEEEA